MKKRSTQLLIVLTVVFAISFYFFSSTEEIENRFMENEEADHPEMFTQYFKDITTEIGKEKPAYKMNYKVIERKKALERLKTLKLKLTSLSWVSRGPANVGGRTRAIIVDPDDTTHKTWFASAATGGIWKTTDGGNTWTNLSDDLSNLAVNAMAMAKSNTNVIYVGTGESFPGSTYLMGNGIWKSIDKGSTWTQLSSTATDENFAYVNRIIIDPADENIVVAATENGIFKSNDGGETWNQVYSSNYGVEDIVANPSDFNIIYAGENSVGVLKSVDAGNTWTVSSNGLVVGNRCEVDVSPVNTDYVFASINISSDKSAVYFSTDAGANWQKFNDDQNFLGGQGSYDNTIAAHPYNADEVYVGGVNIWHLKFDGNTETSAPTVLNAYTENTTFLSFINFGGDFLGGGMSTEEGVSLEAGDTVSVEIRFGPGLSQKAHRFTVPDGSTSGVPAPDYTYVDYIDVPFEVWDITNNRQLMVSFRDQEKTGDFDLYERTGDAYGELGREYIFVNSVTYDANNPSAEIAQDGGHLYKCLYMFWPTLTEGETWDPNNLPDSKIVVNYGTQELRNGTKTSIADAYGEYNGPNEYDQNAGFGTTEIPGLHPDHHSINLISTGNGNFLWIDGNDGGIGYSDDNGATLDQIPVNYITTQFYGVAKNPTANEYIGGMQDNGTWQSASGEDASQNSNYYFRLGGDGFECLWNAEDPQRLLGSIYNNSIYKSANGGEAWFTSTSGIDDGDGPFITRLSASKENPDVVFAVGKSGVYKSTNFGTNWTKKIISNNWTSDGVSSSHNVEVSLANGKIVWAGGAMAKDYKMQLQVSVDEGEHFTPVDDFTDVKMDAYISGIATHPIEDSTAYVLFSNAGKPKILRTKDLGNTWEDISGFGTNNVSDNGFPDVVTHCLLVMPQEPNTIWVGTDIGLFESNDDGATWHIADNGLPPVAVYDMFISGHQVVVATHGRGIWTVDIPEIDNAPYISDFSQVDHLDLSLKSDFKVTYDSVEVYINNLIDTVLVAPLTGLADVGVTVPEYGEYTAKIIAYIADVPYKSNKIVLDVQIPAGFETINADELSVKVYPNPASDYLKIDLGKLNDNALLEMFNEKGQLVLSKENIHSGSQIDISSLKKGFYILRIHDDKFAVTKKLQKF